PERHFGARDAFSITGICRYDRISESLNLERIEFSSAPGKGHFSATPRIERSAAGPVLVIEEGPLAENARFSPAICRNWFKYAAAPLANATEFEGRFTAELEQARIPLLSGISSDAHGTVTIHASEGRVGGLAARIAALATSAESVVRARPPLDRSMMAKW